MHFIYSLILMAQTLTADDISAEMARLNRNFQFLSYGFTAAWIILAIYVLLMVGRERKLKQQIASLRAILEQREPK